MRPIKSTRKFIRKHRVAIAVTLTASTFVALNMRNAKVLNEFLSDHDLLDAWYQDI